MLSICHRLSFPTDYLLQTTIICDQTFRFCLFLEVVVFLFFCPKKIGPILEKYQSVPKMFAQFLKNTKGLPGSRSYFARPWGGSSYGNLSQVGGDDGDDDGGDDDDDGDKLILFHVYLIYL